MHDSKRPIVQVIARKPARLITCAALAVAFTVSPVLSPVTAFAVSAETQAELDRAEQQVDEYAAAYDDAVAKLDELQSKIDENSARIAEIQEQLPSQQEAASQAMRDMYKFQTGSNPLASFVLNSDSMSDFITTCVYMDQIQSANVEAVEELNSMQAELEQRQTELDQAKAQLEEERQKAEEALAAAQQARSEAQAKAEAENAAELAAAMNDTAPGSGSGADAGNPYSTATESGVSANVGLNGGAVNWNVSRDEFISTWTTRINNYLAGSPLAGQGAAFATAAWNSGVDPRWSPAISCIESSKGAHCANSYNAWGWTAGGGGFRGFGSWGQAISEHVAYLRRVYGTTCTVSAAQKYCPPTWQSWYNKVVGEMNRI